MSVCVGLRGRAEEVVTAQKTAEAACSGALNVYGTPFMLALMEKAAWTSIAPHLAAGESTVGTRLDVAHLSASPVGIRVWAESEVTQMDGKRIVLSVTAYDAAGKIGEGIHERYIVTNERFLAKAAGKLEGKRDVD